LGSNEAPVSVRGLTKSYDGRVVVDGLDLTVEAGEMVGLIGANGAGKTTTVECLQGLRRPDSGDVRVLGLDPQHDAQQLRARIGSQLQSSGLPDRIRVDEAVSLFAGRRATDGSRLLEQFGLLHRRRSHFAGMSGGERQRLFLVLALLNRPELVILDELTQGLDPAARREVWSAVTRLRDAGTTVLLVTHEVAEVEATCERVVVMREGRVVDQGTPGALVARHGGPTVVRFTIPTGSRSTPTDARAQLERLPGVDTVELVGERAVLRGARPIIAHAGAWLVASGAVPEDLHVEVPGLEAALLALLDDGEHPAEVAA
jgi:ABC-2 type transport system ATP-binding protein